MMKLEKLIEKLESDDTAKRVSYAKMTNTCKICSQPAKYFEDKLSALEYHISAICQDCQNKYFH